MVTETQKKMSSGEALAEILETVTDIRDRMVRTEEVVGIIVEQVQEVAASGLGNILGGLMGSNGDSEHSPNSS